MEEMHLRNYAYLGDAVWELFVREITTELTHNAKKLHETTTSYVNGGFQSKLLNQISEELDEEELELVRRGRNLPVPVGRKSNQGEYRLATAFEVLIGWWYKNKKERLEYFYNKFKNNF